MNVQPDFIEVRVLRLNLEKGSSLTKWFQLNCLSHLKVMRDLLDVESMPLQVSMSLVIRETHPSFFDGGRIVSVSYSRL